MKKTNFETANYIWLFNLLAFPRNNFEPMEKMIHITGDPEEGMVLLFLIHRAGYSKREERSFTDYFTCTTSWLQKEMKLTPSRRRRLLSRLEKKGFIKVTIGGMPSRRHVRLVLTDFYWPEKN